MVKWFRLIVLLALVAPLRAQQRAPQNESIRQDDLRADLFFLAGDSLRGRLTDTEENRAAADFIRSRFERMGLEPAAGGSYFQNYTLMTATVGDAGANGLDLNLSEDVSRHRALRQDIYPYRFSSSASATGAVAYVR